MEKQELKTELLNKIWKTMKTRMNTAERLKNLDTLFEFLIFYYSFIIIGLSIYSLSNKTFSQKTSIFLIIASTVIGSLSLYVNSKNYKERYINMKSNYIKLNKLYNNLHYTDESSYTTEELRKVAEKYEEILSNVENHKEKDYLMFLMSNKELRKDLPWYKVVKHFLYRFLNVGLFVMTILLPAATLIYFY